MMCVPLRPLLGELLSARHISSCQCACGSSLALVVHVMTLFFSMCCSKCHRWPYRGWGPVGVNGLVPIISAGAMPRTRVSTERGTCVCGECGKRTRKTDSHGLFWAHGPKQGSRQLKGAAAEMFARAAARRQRLEPANLPPLAPPLRRLPGPPDPVLPRLSPPCPPAGAYSAVHAPRLDALELQEAVPGVLSQLPFPLAVAAATERVSTPEPAAAAAAQAGSVQRRVGASLGRKR